MHRSPRILIALDEAALLRALQINLRAHGYDVSTAAAGQAALAEAATRPPDAILLDLDLPDLEGAQVIRELRGWSRAPVIVLSGRAGSGDKIGALDAGADDYVTKPFDMEELLARLRAALRRDTGATVSSPVALGHWSIDLAATTISRRDRPQPGTAGGPPGPGSKAPGPGDQPGQEVSVHLTPTEWRLLELLLRSPGQLVPASRLLTEVWGPGHERNTHYLRFHLASLRRKLEADPARPAYLLTEPGMGYRFRPGRQG